MKRAVFCSVLGLIIVVLVSPETRAALTPRQQLVLSPALQQLIASATPADRFEVLVELRQERPVDISRVAAASLNRTDRYRSVMSRLQNAAGNHDRTLDRVAGQLNSGAAEILHRFWIDNLALLRVDLHALLELSGNDDIVRIIENGSIELMAPVSIASAEESQSGAQYNLALVRARALWSRGLTGAGRVIASIDTGVEGNHPALRHRWRGQDHGSAVGWFDPLKGDTPLDNNGHGTHVMGIMVGRDGADTIGVAPDAEWITAGVVDRGRPLATTFADILSALEWVVDPDGNPATVDDVPDVVCNSWGVTQQVINPCDQLFFDAIDHVEALGIVCVFAAGNEGPFSMSLRNPADRGTSPTSSFSVGACSEADGVFDIPSFSSRGPSACDAVSIKPEIVAPGVNIRSSYKDNSYRTITGTSMAAPHVAAAVALLRQYNPDLTPEEIKLALLSTAQDIGAAGEDNSSGRGLIDLEAALAAVRPPASPSIVIAGIIADASADAIFAPGETGDLVFSIKATGAGAFAVTATLTSLSSCATVSGDAIQLGQLQQGVVFDNSSSPFVVSLDNEARIGDSVLFELRLNGDPGNWQQLDTIGFICGLPEGAILVDAEQSDAKLTISNFGQIGLGPGSILDAGGVGWRSPGEIGNILYEGSLYFGTPNGAPVGCTRGTDAVPEFGFAPVSPPGGSASGSNDALTFTDERAQTPVGVSVSQRLLSSVTESSYSFSILSWAVSTRDGLPIDNLGMAWVFDVDLPGAGHGHELVSFDAAADLLSFASDPDGSVIGIAALGFTPAAVRYFENGNGYKRGLTQTDKNSAFESGLDPSPQSAADYMAIVSTPSVDLNGNSTVTVALALITANDHNALRDASVHAYREWALILGITGGGGTLHPDDFRLSQNYPNPFNAATNIPFTLSGDGIRRVRLDVYNVLGQHVRTLVDGVLPTGPQNVTWDGSGDSGQLLSSGVYLTRLIVDGAAAQTRQMVLLK
ncbi:MAG TPA: S8 family serine peptidase [candidate division Zixibacteria bacterium]|jgi:subtilisin family serine protease